MPLQNEHKGLYYIENFIFVNTYYLAPVICLLSAFLTLAFALFLRTRILLFGRRTLAMDMPCFLEA